MQHVLLDVVFARLASGTLLLFSGLAMLILERVTIRAGMFHGSRRTHVEQSARCVSGCRTRSTRGEASGRVTEQGIVATLDWQATADERLVGCSAVARDPIWLLVVSIVS